MRLRMKLKLSGGKGVQPEWDRRSRKVFFNFFCVFCLLVCVPVFTDGRGLILSKFWRFSSFGKTHWKKFSPFCDLDLCFVLFRSSGCVWWSIKHATGDDYFVVHPKQKRKRKIVLVILFSSFRKFCLHCERGNSRGLDNSSRCLSFFCRFSWKRSGRNSVSPR